MNETDIEKARMAQRAYAKAWRAQNKDKVKANNLRYWARRAEREALASEQTEEGGANHGAGAAISKNNRSL